MKLNPLAGYVLIEPMDEQETTASGLVMPEKAKEKPGKGKVISIGDAIIHYEHFFPKIQGKMLDAIDFGGFAQEHCQVKKGNIVIFHRWAGQDVKDGPKEYRLVKFPDLMGVYE